MGKAAAPASRSTRVGQLEAAPYEACCEKRFGLPPIVNLTNRWQNATDQATKEVFLMARSVKLSDDLMNLVRRESELQSRSVAGHNPLGAYRPRH